PKGGEVFDRLVGGAVLAEEHRVVGPDPYRRSAHQRAEAHGGPHVVAEHEERRPVRPQPAMDGDSVRDGSHGVLADTELDVATGPIRGGEGVGDVDLRLGRLDEVGGAADEAGYLVGDLPKQVLV